MALSLVPGPERFQMKEYERIAMKMLDLESSKDIPRALQLKLERIESLCRKAGGGFYSRQVMAIIIDDFINNPKGE